MTNQELYALLLQEGWVEGNSDPHSMYQPDFEYIWWVHKKVEVEDGEDMLADVYTYPNMDIMVELVEYTTSEPEITHTVYKEGQEVEALAHATRFIAERVAAA